VTVSVITMSYSTFFVGLAIACVAETSSQTPADTAHGEVVMRTRLVLNATAHVLQPHVSSNRRLQTGTCRELSIKFIVQTGDAELAAIEDDIRTNLAVIGIHAQTEYLPKDDLNVAMTSGNFNLCVTVCVCCIMLVSELALNSWRIWLVTTRCQRTPHVSNC
jgi:hypothetical protein